MSEDKYNSIEKVLRILEVLNTQPYEYKVTDIATKTGFNRTTIYRILCTLEDAYFVIKDKNTERYKIGPNLYHMGMRYLENNNYGNKIEELLNEIAEKTKESVGIAIQEGEKVISIFEIEVHQPLKMRDKPGRYFPINRGVYGKCIMAYQDPEYILEQLSKNKFEKLHSNTLTTKEELLEEYARIRRDGFSLSIDEVGEGVCGVGIPLFDYNGKIKAVVGLAFYKRDNFEEELDNFKNVLFSYQKKLEKYLP